MAEPDFLEPFELERELCLWGLAAFFLAFGAGAAKEVFLAAEVLRLRVFFLVELERELERELDLLLFSDLKSSETEPAQADLELLGAISSMSLRAEGEARGASLEEAGLATEARVGRGPRRFSPEM